jgi:PPOX class probable F420-dependent enzyme
VGASKLDELPPWALELVGSARVARLGVVDERDHPRVLPVTFALAEGRVWTAIDTKPKRDPGREPARVRFLRRDPRASLTVDRYSDDWDELAWVQVLGIVQVLDPRDADAGLRALIHKYEQYRSSPPPGPVLALEPTRCLFWRAAVPL